MPKITHSRKFISVPVSPEELRRAHAAAVAAGEAIGLRMPLAQYVRRALNQRIAADEKGRKK